MQDLTNKTVLFIDMDNTLIKTASGKTFAEDITDFRIQLPVLEAIIKKLPNIKHLFIVTNQGGVGTYFTKEDIETKISVILEFSESYLLDHLPSYDFYADWLYCDSMDKEDPMRKPNPGMLKSLVNYWCLNYVDKSAMLMIGDASGKEGDFSDSDKKCAENFGIDYIDVRDFII